MLRRIVVAGLFAAVWMGQPAAFAQEQTRTALLERQRSEKAAQLRPYEPGRLEKILLTIDTEDPLARIAPHNGFFVEYGYSHKPIGSGAGVGAGYRRDLFDRRARVELEGGISIRSYQLLRADVSSPYLLNERLELGVEATYQHHPQEDFYGLGRRSRREHRVSYLFDARRVEGRAVVRPRPGLEVGVRAGQLNSNLGPGEDKAYPTIAARFTDAAAPGLLTQPDFTYTDVFGAIDYRDQPGNARRGGYYSLTWRRMSDSDLNRYGFTTLDARVQQFFPIFDKKRVFAVQGRLTTADPRDGGQVPFYFKPWLGGSHSIRSVNDYRFRDDTVLFFNFEYRWEAFGGLDMALFTDWGTVAPRPSEFDFSNMERAYGIGFRFNTAKAVFFRVDIAAGNGEGVQYLMKFSKMF